MAWVQGYDFKSIILPVIKTDLFVSKGYEKGKYLNWKPNIYTILYSTHYKI